MKEMSQLLEEKRKFWCSLLFCHIFLKVDKMSMHPRNVRQFARKRALNVLQWLSAASFLLTLSDLITLYSLLLRTQSIWPTTEWQGRIGTLLRDVRKIALEAPLSGSVLSNSNDVVRFISMLSSGDFHLVQLQLNDLPEWLRPYGATDLPISSPRMVHTDSLAILQNTWSKPSPTHASLGRKHTWSPETS